MPSQHLAPPDVSTRAVVAVWIAGLYKRHTISSVSSVCSSRLKKKDVIEDLFQCTFPADVMKKEKRRKLFSKARDLFKSNLPKTIFFFLAHCLLFFPGNQENCSSQNVMCQKQRTLYSYMKNKSLYRKQRLARHNNFPTVPVE